MQPLPQEICFRHEWRPYQKRAIESLNEYLENGKLNLVAAPGSGKTVVGLEVVRRIGRPALIIAPTITIREQWVSRLVTHFLPSDELPAWLSTDLHAPGILTAITYQALHCACAGVRDPDEAPGDSDCEESEPAVDGDDPPSRLTHLDEVVEALRRAGVGVLVLDEAHHLRTNWWKSLQQVADKLEGVITVSLTATPPYDVSPAEWQRYFDLCGPIDAEISVPELVLDGHLCPHQDYVYLNRPSDDEAGQLVRFRQEVASAVADICSCDELVQAVCAHPWVSSPMESIEAILSAPEYYTSMLVFMKAAGEMVPRESLGILGAKTTQLPGLDMYWMEVLLNGCFFRDAENYESASVAFQEFRKRLKRVGAIERRSVRLADTEKTARLLSGSVNKLESICEIIDSEARSMGLDLRAVILADFIRRSEMPSSRDDIRPLSRLGVVSAFEALRRRDLPGVKLGVLTGSLVIIPEELVADFQSECVSRSVAADVLHAAPLGYCDGYWRVDIGGESRRVIVEVVTKLFEDGGVNVLIGTKALLGEGWDAPCINSLILASFVGSFMLSNQMRGRAIRSQHGNPNKTANIWHLVCADENGRDAGSDYATLVRRFRSFVGVSADGQSIENGIARLGLGEPPFAPSRIDETNASTMESARDRESLGERWRNALSKGTGYMTDLVRLPEPVLPRRMVFANTVTALMHMGFSIAVLTFAELSKARVRLHSFRDFLVYLAIIAGVSALVSLPMLLKSLWLFLKHGSIERSMGSVATAVLDSLCRCGVMRTPRQKVQVRARVEHGIVTCHLVGATTYENNLFLNSMEELLGPVANPRYLLMRRSIWHGLRQQDCYSVPSVLGVKAEYARTFADHWRWSVGPVSLVYTRNHEGRTTLLRARSRALSAAFVRRSQRLSCWQ